MTDERPFQIVACVFKAGGRTYDYKIDAGLTVSVGDKIKVPSRNGWASVEIVALGVIERPEIPYAWGEAVHASEPAQAASAEAPANPGGILTGHDLAAALRAPDRAGRE